ncbi:MAG: hypothetical protein HYV26_07565 [Candidatus Hydrogenedentes bacterium]|nr:hypothetical protein [Candidatus Hydrogenedentota bacterium]
MRPFLVIAMLVSGNTLAVTSEEMPALAEKYRDTLQLRAYVTVGDTIAFAESEAARQRALEVLRGLGITRVYLESYRAATVASEEALKAARDFMKESGFEVVGGIATYPGPGFGVQANTGLTWFNFQAEETQRALEAVVRTTARVFDSIIIDDFLCTGDTSEISDKVRGNRDWSEYRRDLLVALSQRMIIGPAREENPDITMIIKFPQWYDLFHEFGYDVPRESQLYDRVYVGTETRGANTQRYGFTQPYEGFINYRWINDIAGEKIGGAWFDHADCDANDFLDQAYQSVLAGAPELVLFSYGALDEGHPGHQLLRDDFEQLAALAELVRQHPVRGIPAYKPASSDAGTDMYLLDQLGMLGVPLVPVSRFPEDVNTIFLPTQAASDPAIAEKVLNWLEPGMRRLLMTAGFLAAVDSPVLAKMIQLNEPVTLAPVRTRTIIDGDETETLPTDLGLAARLDIFGARAILQAQTKSETRPYLLTVSGERSSYIILNCETFSQADFEAVNEVLLSPRRLGLLSLPPSWVQAIRSAFGMIDFKAPARVSCQLLPPHAAWVIQNYRDDAAEIELKPLMEIMPATLKRWPDKAVSLSNGLHKAKLAPRERIVLSGD